MKDFWRSAGFHLLERDGDGRLAVTDGFLGAYVRRPELEPVAESCAGEIALRDALLADARLAVAQDRIDAIKDPDARDNFRVLLNFRDLLVEAGTLEACYANLFRGGDVKVPPVFIDQLVRLILRNILDGCDQPLRLRAAELLFRAQMVGLRDGAIMSADAETIKVYGSTGGFGEIGRLLTQADIPTHDVELDVLNADNAEIYWQRDEDHDTVLDLTFGRPGIDALSRVLEAWISHFLKIGTTIAPVGTISDEHWRWHVGLDAEATKILNDLYDGRTLDDERQSRILSLFRLEFDQPAPVRADVAGRPVYLAMAMDEGNILRIKPQNLLVNLPLTEPA